MLSAFGGLLMSKEPFVVGSLPDTYQIRYQQGIDWGQIQPGQTAPVRDIKIATFRRTFTMHQMENGTIATLYELVAL